MILSDASAERAVLAGICKFGAEAYYDVADIINEGTFTVDSNSVIYSCIKRLIVEDDTRKIDIPSILSSAQELGLGTFFQDRAELSHLGAVLKFPVLLDNVRKFGAKTRKLQIARMMYDQLEETRDKYLHLKGDESISHILGLAEESIFDFTGLLNDQDDTPELLFGDLEDHLRDREENKVDQIGISTGFKKFDFAIGGGLRKGTVNIIGARTKAQPLYCKIMTPDGYKLMGDIKVGDIICSPSNKTGYTTVEEVYPFHEKKDVYEISFSDGTKTWACEDHYWKVMYSRNRYYEVLSIKEMLNKMKDGNWCEKSGRCKWRIPYTKPLMMKKQNLPIDPYVLGFLLGDGSIKNHTQFTTADKQILRILEKRLPYNHKINELKNKYSYSITPVERENIVLEGLRELGLFGKGSHDKFIPNIYMKSTVEDRTLLLAGLLDTDGSVGKTNIIEYSSVSKILIDQVKELCMSLGGKCKIKERITKCNGKEFLSYRAHISFNDPSCYFMLDRKSERCKKRTKPDLKKGIVSVKNIGKDYVQCIKVSDPDGLYITDDFIVTHNTGKSLIGLNMGVDIAKRGIPVLYLDTEMIKSDQQNRGGAMISYGTSGKSTINDIETGQFSTTQFRKQGMYELAKNYKNIPMYHKTIGGKPFEDQLSIMRRWLARTVGIADNGKAKDCVIIYDYLKLMDSADIKNDLKEYQVLGFMMTALHNFSLRYQVPILGFIQLNRDGITKESTDAASGSDRIMWLCSNFTIYKQKSDEEIAKDGIENGNRKLVPIIARHGEGLEPNDYINVLMHGKYAKLIEGKTALELNEGGDYEGAPHHEEDVAF